MNQTKKIILALGLLVAGVSHAQTTTTSTSNGLLGQRYGEVSFGAQNVKFLSDHIWSLSATANTVLVPNAVDVGASAGYSWLDEGIDAKIWTIGGYATLYTTLGSAKPFIGAGLGWQKSKANLIGEDDGGIWGLNAGIEIPVGALTLTPRIIYADDFESRANSNEQWTYQVEAHTWIRPTVGVYATVGLTDIVDSPVETWNFNVGVRFKF